MGSIDPKRALKFPWFSELQLYGELLMEAEKPGGQKAMAKKYGISEQHMSDILRNKRPIPKRVAQKMGFMVQKVYFLLPENRISSEGGR